MAYFPALDAPETGELSTSLVTNFQHRMVFHSKQPPDSEPTRRLLFAYLLVVDKGVREYQAGRAALLNHLEDGGIPAFVDGVGRFETCINAVKRAMRLLTKLGNMADAPTVDRTIRKLAQNSSDAITAARDAIEHIENDIVSSGGLKEGEAHVLTVNGAGTNLEIASHQISFHTLRATLAALHKAGIAMIDALPSTTLP